MQTPTPDAAGKADTTSPSDDLADKFNAWLSAHGLAGDAKQVGIVFLSTDTQPVSRESLLEWLSRPLPRAEPPAKAELPPHPSRGLPKCSDCRHRIRAVGPDYCNHHLQPVYPESGDTKVRCSVARNDSERCAKDGMAFCGPSGLLFTPSVG